MTILDDIREEKERQAKIDKTVRNLDGDASVTVYRDGDWWVLKVIDRDGAKAQVVMRDHIAFDIAYALTPELGERHTRYCQARDALYNLTYPDMDPTELRHLANEADCGDCDYLGRSECPRERDSTCGFRLAEGLRKLASALDLKAKIATEIAAEKAKNEPVF